MYIKYDISTKLKFKQCSLLITLSSDFCDFFLLYEIWYTGSIVIVEIPAWIIIYSMFLLDTLAPLLKASYRVFTSPSSYSQRYFPFLQSFDIRDLSFFWKKNKTYDFFFISFCTMKLEKIYHTQSAE